MRNIIVTAFAIAAVVFGVMALTPTPAKALQTSANMNIYANIQGTCTASASSLVFGAYDPGLGNTLTATPITVNCTSGNPWAVTLDDGLHSTTVSGAIQRRMVSDNSASSFLGYNLYWFPDKSAAAATGSGLSYTSATGSVIGTALAGGTGTGLNQTVSITGELPAGQNPPMAGWYSDTITVTILY